MTQIRIKTAAPRPKSWRRKLLWVALGFLLLLVALYFVVTSSVFLRKVVLPQLSDALEADITVADLQVSPFHRLVLKDVKIHPRSNEPLLTVKEARANYSLLSILRGNIEVSEVTLESPVLTIFEDTEGRSNLDFLKSDDTNAPPAADSTSSSPLQLNLKLVTLHNATIRTTKKYLYGSPDVVEVSGLNFKLQNLRNGQAGQVELALDAALDKSAQSNRAASSLAARLDGQFTFELAANLIPKAVKGGLNLSVTNATGSLAELNALGVKLDCETTATEVKQVALHFNKAEAAVGEVRVSGPLDLARLEGKLKLEVLALDRRLLNLVAPASGIDFGTTTVNASTEIELLRGGSVISLAGRLAAADLQVVQQDRTSPTFDLRCDYATTIDTTAKTAEVRFLNISAAQDKEPFLQSELPHSLTIAWGEAAPQANDASFNLTVTEFDLSAWRKFLGDKSLSGDIAGKLQLTARNDGRQLRMELTGNVEDFSAKLGTNRINDVDCRLTSRLSVMDLKEIKLESFRLELLHKAQSVFVATAFGGMQGDASGDLELTAQVELAQLFAALRVPGLSVTDGTFNFQTHVQQKDARQNATGRFKLTDFSATQGNIQLTHLGADFDFGITAGESIVEIQKLAGQLHVGDKLGGRVDAGGKLDLAGKLAQGQGRVKLDDVNQELVRPFLAATLGSNQLASIDVHLNAVVDLSTNQELTLQAETQVTNLVVSTPEHPEGTAPLEIRFGADVVTSNQVLHIRGCNLNLTPTERARNELKLAGALDLSQSNAISGSLKLSAEALDFTGYYDLLGAAPAPEAGTKPPPPEAGEPALEPEATTLPFQNFTCDVELGHVYLREMDVSNWRSSLKISGGQITLNPCKFAVNGGPVEINAEADLGVPGYRYGVGLNARSIPVPPLLNTFTSGGGGDIGGQLIVNLDFKGTGVTGTSLQTNLIGQFNLMTTNMNLAIGKVEIPILNLIINTVLGLPDLIGGLTGRREAGQMRWAEEITAHPIEVMLLDGGMANGKLEVKEALVKSVAFQVQSTGEIKFAPDSKDSTVHFPLQVSLGRQYAEKLGMVHFNTPTNAIYIALPNFLTVKGSLANVKTDFSEAGLLLLAGKSLGGVGLETGKAIGNVGLDAGKAVGGAGKMLFGTASGLFKPRAKHPETNAPAGSGTNNVAEPDKK